MDLLANVLPAHYNTLLGTIRHIPASPSVWSSTRSEQRMERKMDTNSNFSNYNTQIYARTLPVMNYHKETIDQLTNPVLTAHLTTIENCCWFKSIDKRRLHSDSLAGTRSFANEQ
jgi:hypothetical protein